MGMPGGVAGVVGVVGRADATAGGVGAEAIASPADLDGKAPASAARVLWGPKSFAAPGGGAIVITPSHTEQRARTETPGIFAGST